MREPTPFEKRVKKEAEELRCIGTPRALEVAKILDRLIEDYQRAQITELTILRVAAENAVRALEKEMEIKAADSSPQGGYEEVIDLEESYRRIRRSGIDESLKHDSTRPPSKKHS
jgi:hypothetical protein